MAPPTAPSRSASSKTISGDLPPSSSVTVLQPRRPPQTLAPVGTEPVTEILAMRGVGGERRADRAAALDHVEGAGGQAGLGEDLGELQRAERRELGGLEDHGVAAGERRRRLPAGDLAGVVPGADAGADARAARGGCRRSRRRGRSPRRRARRRGAPNHSSASAPEAQSATRVSAIGLPVSSVSSSESSRLRARMRSAARRSTRPRAAGGRGGPGGEAGLRGARSPGRSTAGVAACSRAMGSAVAG